MLRKEAAAKRWMPVFDQVESDGDEEKDATAEKQEEEQEEEKQKAGCDVFGRMEDVEDEDEEEEEGRSSRSPEKPHGSMSAKTLCRRMVDLRRILSGFTSREKADITMGLLQRVGSFMKPGKLLLQIPKEAVREWSKEHFCLLSSYHIRTTCASIISILDSVTEPEILLEELVMRILLKNNLVSSLLLSTGIVLDDSLRSRDLVAREAAVRVALRLTQRRQGKDKAYAVEHACGTAAEAGLSLDIAGDTAVLARAIRWGRNNHFCLTFQFPQLQQSLC